jgi:predicted rRNA pseudouridine synthase
MEYKSGLILLNKPKGPTSSQVAGWVKEIIGAKCGHCGTLDPNVSGVLPILFGKGIKLLEYLQKHDKEYVCIMATEKEIPAEKIKEVFAKFTGKILQAVPEHAAVARRIRKRQIYECELLEKKDKLVLFRVYCQHGTYIRKLIEDFGLALGTKTEMIELRRTKVAAFDEEMCCSLVQLKDAAELCKEGKKEYLEKLIFPLESAVKSFPKIFIKKTAAKSLCKGADLYAAGFVLAEGEFGKGNVVILMAGDKLIAVGKALCNKKKMEQKEKQKEKGAVVDLEKVLV